GRLRSRPAAAVPRGDASRFDASGDSPRTWPQGTRLGSTRPGTVPGRGPRGRVSVRRVRGQSPAVAPGDASLQGCRAMGAATWGLVTATFTASFVEFVEALTIVLAMGLTRGWRSALAGVGAAAVALSGFTAAAGYALATWLPRSALQLGIGTLLLVFGLQWLRKAVLRSAG